MASDSRMNYSFYVGLLGSVTGSAGASWRRLHHRRFWPSYSQCVILSHSDKT